MRPEECGCCPSRKECPTGGCPMVDQCDKMNIHDQIMTYYVNGESSRAFAQLSRKISPQGLIGRGEQGRQDGLHDGRVLGSPVVTHDSDGDAISYGNNQVAMSNAI